MSWRRPGKVTAEAAATLPPLTVAAKGTVKPPFVTVRDLEAEKRDLKARTKRARTPETVQRLKEQLRDVHVEIAKRGEGRYFR